MFISIVITFPYTQKGTESLFQALFFPFQHDSLLDCIKCVKNRIPTVEKTVQGARLFWFPSTILLNVFGRHFVTLSLPEMFFYLIFFVIVHFRRSLKPALNIRERKILQKKATRLFRWQMSVAPHAEQTVLPQSSLVFCWCYASTFGHLCLAHLSSLHEAQD